MTTLICVYAGMTIAEVLTKLHFLARGVLIEKTRRDEVVDVISGVILIVCTAFVVARGY